MIVDYTCKFCGDKRTVEVPDIPDTILQVDKWRKMLCCDPCGFYMENRNSITRKVKAICIYVMQSRATIKDRSKLADIEGRAKEKLSDLTKRFARVVSDHFQKPNVWDSEFVVMLMEYPDRFYKILNDYVKHLRQQPVYQPEMIPLA